MMGDRLGEGMAQDGRRPVVTGRRQLSRQKGSSERVAF